MLEKSFGLHFYLKQSKSEKEKLRYVYLRITVDGRFKEISTKMLWHPERWNARLGRASGNKEDAKNLNSYLETFSGKVYQTKKMLMDQDRDISAEALRDVLPGRTEDRRMILVVFQYHNDQMKALIGFDFLSNEHRNPPALLYFLRFNNFFFVMDVYI